MCKVSARISGLTQGLPTLSWPPTPEPSPPNPLPFWVLQEKQTKRFTWALVCFWDGQIFSHQFLIVPDCPTLLLGIDLSLPLKFCSYCSPGRRCFKTLLRGQTNYFYQLPSEITPERERSFMDVWSKDPQISSSADGIQAWLYPFLRFLTPLPSCLPPRALSPFTLA